MPHPGGSYASKPRGTPIVSRQQQYAALDTRTRQITRHRPEPAPDPALVKAFNEMPLPSRETATEKMAEGLKNCRTIIRTCPFCHETRTEKYCHCKKTTKARRE